MAYITITSYTDDGVITFQERVATGQMVRVQPPGF